MRRLSDAFLKRSGCVRVICLWLAAELSGWLKGVSVWCDGTAAQITCHWNICIGPFLERWSRPLRRPKFFVAIYALGSRGWKSGNIYSCRLGLKDVSRTHTPRTELIAENVPEKINRDTNHRTWKTHGLFSLRGWRCRDYVFSFVSYYWLRSRYS